MSDITAYRMDAYERRADVADARMQHIEQLLTEIRIDIARKPSTAALWGMIATTVGIAAALIALFVGILTYLQAFHVTR